MVFQMTPGVGTGGEQVEANFNPFSSSLSYGRPWIRKQAKTNHHQTTKSVLKVKGQLPAIPEDAQLLVLSLL